MNVFSMRSGNIVSLDPNVSGDRIEITDILQSIALERRFYNQTDWTVLQHSVACGVVAQSLFPGNNLLIKFVYCHDLHEAFVRDVPHHIKTPEFHKMESEIQTKLLNALNVDIPNDDMQEVHKIDRHMSFVESQMFLASDYTSDRILYAIKESYGDVNASLIVECTQATSLVANLPLIDEYHNITAQTLDIFRTALNMQI
jgi:hypothetical protein